MTRIHLSLSYVHLWKESRYTYRHRSWHAHVTWRYMWHDVSHIPRMNESCYTYERSHVTRIDIGRDRHTWHDVIRDMTLGCIHMCEICPLQYVCGSYHIFGKKMGRNIHKGGHRLSQVCHVGYISSNGVYIFHRYDTMNHSFIRGICFS